jgi:hypothetical protein
MPSWSRFTSPQFPFRVSFPDPTPGGAPVVVHQRGGEGGYRLHLVSEGSDEVYFELGRYEQLTRQAAVEAFIQDVSGRIEGLHHSQLVEIEWHGQPAARFSIDWPGKERIILFFERDAVLYRIIYDPASLVNQEILASFEWLDTG